MSEDKEMKKLQELKRKALKQRQFVEDKLGQMIAIFEKNPDKYAEDLKEAREAALHIESAQAQMVELLKKTGPIPISRH